MIKLSKPEKSNKYYGVYKHASKYRVIIGHNKKQERLGVFENAIDAAHAYDDAVKKYGFDRRLNFPDTEPENLIPNTRLIRLTQGKFAIVDEEDFEELNKYEWTSAKNKNITYATTNAQLGSCKKVFMHSLIMNNLNSDTDHINGNGLHNYKSNLRKSTVQQNNMNRKSTDGCFSKYKGVIWNKRLNKYMSRIKINKKSIHIGLFLNESEAAKAYDAKAKELFGEFAWLNFPELQTSTNL